MGGYQIRTETLASVLHAGMIRPVMVATLPAKFF
jgi:hypothetical protein